MVANNRRGLASPEQVSTMHHGISLCHGDVFWILEHRYILAVIQPCSTGGKDATRELATYSEWNMAG
jgi:hypothetical protein